jgi:H+/Na+-translocating ferredoxin:NAD+ oxidoreductase subunit G
MARILRLGIILMLFCVISAGGLAYVYLFTQPRIDLNAKLAFENSLREVVPAAANFTEIKLGDQKIYSGLKDNKRVGYAIPVSPRGYSGPIDMLLGLDLKGKVVGIKILNQRETPGLGANIVKPDFWRQFLGKTAQSPLEPKKDIEAITGATISSRAVCNGTRLALELFKKVPK